MPSLTAASGTPTGLAGPPDTVEDRYGPQTAPPAPASVPRQAPAPGRPYGAPQASYAAAATPVDPLWDGIAAGYKTELEDLALQWQQVAGFNVTIDEPTLRKMADAHVVALRDMGQWIWNQSPLLSTQEKQRAPWLAWGLDQTSWNRQLSDYLDSYEQLTGQRPAFAISDQGQLSGESQRFWGAFADNLTQTGLRERLLHDDSIQQQFGWVRFGLDYDTFQQRKVDMRMTFGFDVSNDQAVLQLQYLHQAQGASRAVQAQAPAGQQGSVTPTEVEVR